MDNVDHRNACSNPTSASVSSQKALSRISFTPSPATPFQQQLYSCFSDSGRSLQPAKRKLAWVSLEGRLVEADAATSAMTVSGGLSMKEAIAWELFSPLQRVLLVAVVAAATAESRKTQEISALQRSVELRDLILQSMQQKLDTLCQQMSAIRDLPTETKEETHASADTQFLDADTTGPDGWKLCNCANGFFLPCDNDIVSAKNPDSQVDASVDADNACRATEMTIIWPEERRMSDLSDFGFSVASQSENHFSRPGVEQCCCKAKLECEEKNALIEELLATNHATELASQKRIAELEDVIKRKNLVISKQKKDLVFLEQKVIQLTRMNRKSYTKDHPKQDSWDLPLMTNNILYDMSSSGSSSSDSDSTKNVDDRRCSLNNDPVKGNITRAGNEEPKSRPSSASSGARSSSERRERPLTPVKIKPASSNTQSVSSLSSNNVIKKPGLQIQRTKEHVRSRPV